MNRLTKTLLAVAGALLATQAAAQITFYEDENFSGRSFTPQRSQLADFQRQDFNDRASSVIVLRDRWEVCDQVRFGGRCVVLAPGRYRSLAAMGLNDHVSSMRSVGRSEAIDEYRYAPRPDPVYDNSRRDNERLFEADVVSVRAVVGPPERRCWIEREQVSEEQTTANVPGAVAGALIGGILGHQIGRGGGRDIATVGGAVGGAALGANVGRGSDGQRTVARDVQHCDENSRPARPDYWDVSYRFRGIEHRIQMTSPPGDTITVNRRGEPRA